MIFKVLLDDITVPEGRRSLDQDKVKQIAESMSHLGQLSPILVRQEGQHLRLIAGNHRLAAAVSLGWTEIEAVFLDGDDTQMRRVEIAENLHRNELTALERDELLAEWIKLTDGDASQVETHRKAGQQPGGVNAAARELGVSKADAHRAVKVANLSPEAKEVARTAGLANNRSTLLAAAKEGSPERQVEMLKSRAANPKLSPPSSSTSSPPPKSTSAARLRELVLQGQSQLRAQAGHINRLIDDLRAAEADKRRLVDRVEELEAENARLRARITELERAAPSPAGETDPLDIPAEFRRAQP